MTVPRRQPVNQCLHKLKKAERTSVKISARCASPSQHVPKNKRVNSLKGGRPQRHRRTRLDGGGGGGGGGGGVRKMKCKLKMDGRGTTSWSEIHWSQSRESFRRDTRFRGKRKKVKYAAWRMFWTLLLRFLLQTRRFLHVDFHLARGQRLAALNHHQRIQEEARHAVRSGCC